MAPLDFGAPSYDLGTFDTSFGSAGADPFGTISYDIPPAGSLLQFDPSLTGGWGSSSAGWSGNSLQSSLFSAPVGNQLSVPVSPAPQSATAGNLPGNTWAPLLGFGAPIVGAAVGALAKSGIVQHTNANGASVGMRAAGAPVRTLFDTINQGVTGKTLVLGAVVLLALIYGINKVA